MGMHLIAFSFTNPADWLVVLQVAIGLGMVIFIHELGHFAVAKMCGVKCEKFYLGFDIFGLKLARFRWGETEYGIGVLPLGGYVKMLGQEDNPARVAEEMERARQAQERGEQVEMSPETAALFDPRSYLAKSVPQRMAIISAGVIMNVIFAFVVSVAAYAYGVQEPACVVGYAVPGQAAWRAGLRPGDHIVQIGDIKDPLFRDLQKRVVLGDNLEAGVPLVIERPGVSKPIELTIVPDTKSTGRLAPQIGIRGIETSTLHDKQAVFRAAARLTPEAAKLAPNDTIIAVDGVAVASIDELESYLAQHTGDVTLTVQRPVPLADGQVAPAGEDAIEELELKLPGYPRRDLGLIMEMGPLTAVQDGSPAAAAGLQRGDELVSIAGEPIGDPLLLEQRMMGRLGETLPVNYVRNGKPLETSITVRAPLQLESGNRAASPTGATVGVSTLGVAYDVGRRVAAVIDGSPAAKASIKPGDVVAQAEFIYPKVSDEEKKETIDDAIEFKPGSTLWPQFMALLQGTFPDTKVKLTLDDERTETLTPEIDPTTFVADRGLIFAPLLVDIQANSFGQAVSLGLEETWDALTKVYRFLSKLGHQVSIKGMAGPVSIFGIAYHSASSGLSTFLLFLAMLSANLAVINFLPIPVLDGGHMVFLALEGIRGKPVSERVVIAFHYAGFLFILGLMMFVLSLDVGLISRF